MFIFDSRLYAQACQYRNHELPEFTRASSKHISNHMTMSKTELLHTWGIEKNNNHSRRAKIFNPFQPTGPF